MKTTYEIVFSESNSSQTRRYEADSDSLPGATAEARELLKGAVVGEGFVRVDSSDGEPLFEQRA